MRIEFDAGLERIHGVFELASVRLGRMDELGPLWIIVHMKRELCQSLAYKLTKMLSGVVAIDARSG
jgi:hypothetical protein